jgi:hypothetical protein
MLRLRGGKTFVKEEDSKEVNGLGLVRITAPPFIGGIPMRRETRVITNVNDRLRLIFANIRRHRTLDRTILDNCIR